jgi:hypothetical protein
VAHQEAVTVRAWIRPGALEALRAELAEVGNDVEENALVPFGSFGNIHFARLVIVPEGRDLQDQVIPPSLVYAVNVDGSGRDHLRELVRKAPEGIDRIWSHCESYPGTPTEEARYRFLDERQIPSQAFYVNTVGRTARQVREEAALREALEAELDRIVASGEPLEPLALQTRLRKWVEEREELAFVRRPARGLSLAGRLRERIGFFSTLLGLLIVSPLLLLALPVFVVALRRHEISDARKREPLRISDEEDFALRLSEDQVVQNQISAVGNVKPGAFRYWTLRVFLWALDFASRHVFNHGDLGTVKPLGLYGVDTIHFAQWILMDDGRRVLFFSNYDGSLVSYMDDFVNKVAWGLNAVFSNGALYPDTRWLFLDGAKNEQQFKAFLHRHQIPTQAWYSAHKRYTAANLLNNEAIRTGLLSSKEEDCLSWLARL